MAGTLRTAVIAATSCAAWLLGSMPAVAQQDYPNKPIRAVIGFAAGSGADIMCRWFTTKIGEIAGQTLVVENKPGAFASIAHNVVATARPDGYTVLLAGSAIITGGRHLIKDLPFDVNGFVPAAGMTET